MARFPLAVAGLCCLGAAAPPLTPLPAQPAGVPFPTLEWPTGPLPKGVDAAALETSLDAVNPRPHLGETRAIVIVQGGRIVAERYMPGYGPDTRLLSWSMAKSVTHALGGVAVRYRLVDIDKPMGNPRWAKNDRRAAITWRQWMNMVDGQDYREIGETDPTRSSVTQMLFGAGRLDVAGFAATVPLLHEPGSHWNYNSAGVNLIADALAGVFAPGADERDRRVRVRDTLSQELFKPLGMSSAQPEFDHAGTFIGSAFVYATARDFARFGLLYLRDGVWDGRRILPEGWVDFARTKTPAENCDSYGALWWIAPREGTGKPHFTVTAGGPKDLFAAQGFEGQLTVVVPSKDLVIVRLGLLEDDQGWNSLGEWLQRLVARFPDVPPR